MEDTRARWERAFLEALDFDTWGQVEEATEGYQRLQVAAAAEYVENILLLELPRRDGIGKLASVLKLRIKELQSGHDKPIGLIGMKKLKPFMKSMIINDVKFPLTDIDPEAVLGMGPLENTLEHEQQVELQESWEEEGDAPKVGGGRPAQATSGTLRGRPTNLREGDRMLTVHIEKWGFKEASSFLEPQVVMSVRDKNGEVVEAVQETPFGHRMQGNMNYTVFDSTIYVQTPLNKLGHQGAIFFEFKHYKRDKKKKSCKAYAILEMDEVHTGPCTLEIYKKPPQYNLNRSPSLLSVKPFYLHLNLTVENYS